MKIISWNVNGIRAVAKKDFFKDLKHMYPDILCLQETKAQDDQVAEVLAQTDALRGVFLTRPRRRDTRVQPCFPKTKPLSVRKDIGMART